MTEKTSTKEAITLQEASFTTFPMSENTPSHPPASTTPSAAGASRNYLSADIEIKGNITFRSDMTIDGKVDGEISSSDAVLTLGENAEVHGEIKTRSVVVRGAVNGNITVADRCELRGNAELVGDLKAKQLVIEENVTLVGRTNVNPKGVDTDVAGANPAGNRQGGLFNR